jgi:ABC-type dipeptide/oligopeptide/nickel transport system permease component
VQYAGWFERLVTLDLGESFKDNRPVWDKIRERLPVTITLNLVSIFLTYLIAIPLGIYSSVRAGSWLDSLLTTSVFMLSHTVVLGRTLISSTSASTISVPASRPSFARPDPSWPLLRRLRTTHGTSPCRSCADHAAFAALALHAGSMLGTLQDTCAPRGKVSPSAW